MKLYIICNYAWLLVYLQDHEKLKDRSLVNVNYNKQKVVNTNWVNCLTQAHN